MKTIFSVLFLCLVLFHSPPLVWSAWEPDVRLSNYPATNMQTSYNQAWCVAVSGNNVHVAWTDERDGHAEIYYKRSTNNGVSWGLGCQTHYQQRQRDALAFDGGRG